MKKAQLINLVLICCVLAVPFFYDYYSDAMERLKSENIVNSLLLEIRIKNTEVTKDVLQNYNHLENNYDSLAQAQLDMLAVHRTFKKQLIEKESTVTSQASIVSQHLKQYDQNIERFKSIHAKITNSLRYLPALNRELQLHPQLKQGNKTKSLNRAVNNLVINLLKLRLFSDSISLSEAKAQITHIESQASQLSKEKSLFYKAFILHANLFIDSRKEESKIVNSILNSRVSQEISLLEKQILNQHNNDYLALQKREQYLFAYIVLLLTIFVINRYSLIKKAFIHKIRSEKDPLTNLNNRRFFISQLKSSLKNIKQTKNGGAVIFIDIDNFKLVNDQLGHNQGDRLLCHFSQLLENFSQANSTPLCQLSIARLGGDEFVILLIQKRQSNIEESVKKISQKLLALFNNEIGPQYHQQNISTSIGIALFPQQSTNTVELLNFADRAMYQSKKQGKNCYNIYISSDKVK